MVEAITQTLQVQQVEGLKGEHKGVLKEGLKVHRFEGYHTQEDLKEMIDEIMEVKFPIHSRRMDALDPQLKSNKEASSFLKRMLVGFNDANMAQAHWQNLLIHLLLKHLPVNEVFRKQRDWLSNYLSEISTKKEPHRRQI